MTKDLRQPSDHGSLSGGTDQPAEPVADTETAAVLDEAITSLALLRHPGLIGDAGAHLHDLVSLVAQADAVLPGGVAEARDQDYTWAQIGDRLGLSRPRAWWRYGRPGRCHHGHPVTD